MTVQWSESEVALLIKLKAEGKPWKFIAEALPRHSRSACEQRYYSRNGRPKPAERPAARTIVVQQAKDTRTASRAVPTSRLVIDAEIRARIELQGLTAGLLGDPPAGRSALDKRLGGVAEPVAPPTQGRRPPAAVTLAKASPS